MSNIHEPINTHLQTNQPITLRINTRKQLRERDDSADKYKNGERILR